MARPFHRFTRNLARPASDRCRKISLRWLATAHRWIPTASAPGYDHITSGIGAAMIGWVGKYAPEQGVSEQEALKTGMEEKSREFAEKGNETYAKA